VHVNRFAVDRKRLSRICARYLEKRVDMACVRGPASEDTARVVEGLAERRWNGCRMGS
jgi:hypothetical protein